MNLNDKVKYLDYKLPFSVNFLNFVKNLSL